MTWSALAGLLALSGIAAPRMDRSKLQIGVYDLAHQDEKHIAEMKECGIDFVVGYIDKGSRNVLDLFAKYGMGVVVSHVYPSRKWMSDPGTLEKQHPFAEYRQAVADFQAKYDHPAVWMIEGEDEPSAIDFPYIAKTIKLAADALPETPVYLNLLPNYATVAENSADAVKSQLGTTTYREHVEAYCREIPLDYISYDFYVYNSNPRRRKELLAEMYANFIDVSDCCRATGRSFWYIPQVNSHPGSPEFPPEWTSANRLRFQAYSAMAYGAEAITWACWSPGWWTNNVLTASGEKTEQYEKLKAVNAELHRLGSAYMRFRTVATHFVGDFPGYVLDRVGRTYLKQLDTGFVRNVKTVEGTPLLVGEMVPRKDLGSRVRALFVVSSGDFEDLAPAVRTVTFSVPGKAQVKVFGPDGEIATTQTADGAHSFPLAENAGALVVVR